VSGIGTNDTAAPGAAYTGAAIQIGPFTASGLTAATTVTPATGALSTYTKIKVGSASAASSVSVSNGDTVTVVFDLATYVADNGSQSYAAVIQPKIKAGTFTITFGSAITMCSDPSLPPPAGNKTCK